MNTATTTTPTSRPRVSFDSTVKDHLRPFGVAEQDADYVKALRALSRAESGYQEILARQAAADDAIDQAQAALDERSAAFDEAVKSGAGEQAEREALRAIERAEENLKLAKRRKSAKPLGEEIKKAETAVEEAKKAVKDSLSAANRRIYEAITVSMAGDVWAALGVAADRYRAAGFSRKEDSSAEDLWRKISHDSMPREYFRRDVKKALALANPADHAAADGGDVG